MRTEKQNQVLQRMEKKVTSLEKKNSKLEDEMIRRGVEVTKMIKIFLMIEHLLPEGPREEFREVAVGYALRCDNGRGRSYCKGEIDFRDKGITLKHTPHQQMI